MARYLEQMLSNRVLRDDWIDLPLCQIILTQEDDRLSKFETFFDELERANPSLPRQICWLSGSEPDFDEKIHDMWTELLTAVWLLRHGYTDVNKITVEDRKTPDFECYLNGDFVIVEAKNLRAPREIFEYMSNRLRSRALQLPTTFGQFSFQIDVRGDAFPQNEMQSEDYEKVSKILEMMDNRVLLDGQETFEYSFVHRQVNIHRAITIKWKQSKIFLVMGRSDSFYRHIGSDPSGEQRIALVRKTWSKISDATFQIQSHPKCSSAKKLILLNWMQPVSLQPDDDFIKWYKSFLVSCNNILESTSAHFGVQLLELTS